MSGRQGQLPFAPMLGTVPHVYGKLGGGIWFLAAHARREAMPYQGASWPSQGTFLGTHPCM